MRERWRDVSGYIGKYQVSDLGRVKSVGRYIRPHGKMIWIDKIVLLKFQEDNRGYLTVHLFKKKHKHLKVHRLVALAFVSNPLNKPTVNHEDGDKKNNKYKNLKWATVKENNLHKDRVLFPGRENYQWGGKVICLNNHKVFASAACACRELNISPSHLSNCLNGKISNIKGLMFKCQEIK
jgi:hypothetical protein